jgi:SSS family solute:Na+ symporter
MNGLAAVVVVAYLLVTLAMGVVAGRRGRGDVTDFVAGERSFGPVVMYFVIGATIFSAFALLGTPRRVISHGSDVFYILAYGAVGLVPLFFFGARVRRIGAREGFVTQAELIGARFASPRVTALMGIASVVAFLPYLVIQLKGAGIVMHEVLGMRAELGAGLVYAVVLIYVLVGGVRGVGWTNVLQGIAMFIVVWGLGLWIPHALFGGVEPMFDRVLAESPEHLTLPGPGARSTLGRYSSEILVSILGFSMWPHVFMKCFTARSARLVQHSVMLYPTFLFFLVPLIFLGYAALLMGGQPDERVLLWLVRHEELGGGALQTGAFAFVGFAVLAASMSTGDALLHAGGSILVRDVIVPIKGHVDVAGQTRTIRWIIATIAIAAFALYLLIEGVGNGAEPGGVSVVDLLLLAFAIPIQFLPLVLLGLYWRGANRVGAEWGLIAGLLTVLMLFVAKITVPELHELVNPADLQIGVYGVVVNSLVLVILSKLGTPPARALLERFEL